MFSCDPTLNWWWEQFNCFSVHAVEIELDIMDLWRLLLEYRTGVLIAGRLNSVSLLPEIQSHGRKVVESYSVDVGPQTPH